MYDSLIVSYKTERMPEKTIEEAIEQFKESMSPADRAAYEIAIRQLESSFDIEKCIGFIDYINAQDITIVKP